MVYKAWYDSSTKSYCCSCRCVYCPIHGVRECRRRFHRKKKAFKEGWGFRSWVYHFNRVSTSDEIKDVVAIVRKAVHRWDRKAVVGFVLHPLDEHWHLHVGIQSACLASTDAPEPTSRRGRPKKHNYESAVRDFCLETRKKKDGGRWVRGRFNDEPENWLWYALRCKKGWTEHERLPSGRSYRLTYGLVVRRPRRPAKPEPDIIQTDLGDDCVNDHDVGAVAQVVPAWLVLLAVLGVVPAVASRSPVKRRLLEEVEGEEANVPLALPIPILPRPPPRQTHVLQVLVHMPDLLQDCRRGYRETPHPADVIQKKGTQSPTRPGRRGVMRLFRMSISTPETLQRDMPRSRTGMGRSKEIILLAAQERDRQPLHPPQGRPPSVAR